MIFAANLEAEDLEGVTILPKPDEVRTLQKNPETELIKKRDIDLAKIVYENELSRRIFLTRNRKRYEPINDGSINDKYHFAVFDKKDKVIRVAFPGTDVQGKRGWDKTFSDLKADLMILSNTERFNTRFESAAAYVLQLQNKNPNIPIELTGHSLGGAIAAYVANYLNLKATTFNAPVKPWNVNENTLNVIQYGDPVSILSYIGNRLEEYSNFQMYKGQTEILYKDKSSLFDPIRNHSIDELVSSIGR